MEQFDEEDVMYCIFHLPRCGSHYVHSLLKTSLALGNAIHLSDEDEPFNPAYNTLEQVHEKYQKMIARTPRPVVKMVINHYPWLAEKFLEDEMYTTIFIEPKNYRTRLLKALVEKQLDTFSNGTDRKNSRERFLGQLEFTEDKIVERLEHYQSHMMYRDRCDVVVLDEDVFQHPDQLMKQLNLEYVGAKYKRKAPYHSDEAMLKDVNQFNEMYEQLSMKIIGKVL